MRIFLLLFFISLAVSFSAPKKTDSQIKEQKNALKKLELDLAKKRKELAELESEEKGVLNTLSLLDQNLNQTRYYLQELSKNEALVIQNLENLTHDLDSLEKAIVERKKAMNTRIRTLYIKGRFSDAKILYEMLSQNKNPERQVYLVHRLLNQDKEAVEFLMHLIEERDEKKRLETEHLADLNKLRERKAKEEKGLVLQMNGQAQMLSALKNDKATQQRALEEFERNQKTMLALIKKLEEKRKKEIAEAKKAEAERKKKKEKKPKVSKPKKTVSESVKGPKCMPLEGEIISHFGLQDHPVLHIPTRNLGIEIRGKRGNMVRAAAAGTVVMVSEIDGRGPSVILEHEGGTYSVYGHLRSIRVKEGTTVENCEQIGEVGDIASLNGIKLYFQVSEGTQTINPLEWLKRK